MTPADIKRLFGQDLTPTPGNDFTIFSDILSIVQPKRMLETGFHSGGSAYMLLHLTSALGSTLTSIDPMGGSDPLSHTGNMCNVKLLQDLFPNRFTFLHKKSNETKDDLVGQSFDLFNIDGDHSYTGATVDFVIAMGLNIPWLILDDFISPVRDCYDLEMVKHYCPVKVYERDDRHKGKAIPRVLLKKRGFGPPDTCVELPSWR